MNLPEIIKGQKVTLIRPYPATFKLTNVAKLAEYHCMVKNLK